MKSLSFITFLRNKTQKSDPRGENGSKLSGKVKFSPLWTKSLLRDTLCVLLYIYAICAVLLEFVISHPSERHQGHKVYHDRAQAWLWTVPTQDISLNTLYTEWTAMSWGILSSGQIKASLREMRFHLKLSLPILMLIFIPRCSSWDGWYDKLQTRLLVKMMSYIVHNISHTTSKIDWSSKPAAWLLERIISLALRLFCFQQLHWSQTPKAAVKNHELIP